MSESAVGAAILQRNLRPGVYWGESEDTHPDLLLDSLPTHGGSPSGKSLIGPMLRPLVAAFPSSPRSGSATSLSEGVEPGAWPEVAAAPSQFPLPKDPAPRSSTA